jgi:hypothetical protein
MMDMDDKGRLRNVFWVDARSRASYEFFGDVITFDTTYLTNRYDMPFAPFVIVNHHGQSILLGAGLISNEDTETFAWLFNTWLGCMNGKAPNAIVTDQARAMRNATEIVFPKITRHRYCLWHILRKLPEKFGTHAQFNGIKSALNTSVYDSRTIEEFEENWKLLVETYKLEDNDWLNGLYSDRTFWVPAYMKDIFCPRMNTTQWSESMNSFFDGYVHSKTTLKEFVDQFDSALSKMVEKKAISDFDSFNCMIPCLTPYPLEKTFQDVYTNVKFKEVQEEFVKVISCNHSCLRSESAICIYEVIELGVVNGNMKEIPYHVYYNEKEVKVKCICALLETRGILCRHAISMLLSKMHTILPPRYYLSRWRKDIKRRYTLVKSSYDTFGVNPNDERYDIMCKNFSKLALLASKSVDKYKKVMKNVDMLTKEFCESRPEPINITVLSPIKVKRIGRPRSTRMMSILEKKVKKSKRKKKVASDNEAKPKRKKKQVRKIFACFT